MNKKTIIHTSQAPAAIGPYVQAVGYQGLLFLSGQVALDSHTGALLQGGVEEQTRLVMQNIQGIMGAAGLDMTHILRVTIYLKNMSDTHTVNDIYGEYFDEHPPARTTVEVSRLPHDALIQIEVMAAAPAQVAPEVPSEKEGAGDDAPSEESAPVLEGDSEWTSTGFEPPKEEG